jgi:hypothetical protein
VNLETRALHRISTLTGADVHRHLLKGRLRLIGSCADADTCPNYLGRAITARTQRVFARRRQRTVVGQRSGYR